MNTPWHYLADQVLDNRPVTDEQALSILHTPDADLLHLLAAAYSIRQATFGKSVQLHMLINIRSGLCPEDCAYCSQSRLSTSEIQKYPFLPDEKIMEGAKRAAELGCRTLCMVASGRGPTNQEVDRFTRLVREIKALYPLRLCASLGLLTDAQAETLHTAGVDRVNHNLNTSEHHYTEICNTHTFADRIRTLENVKAAGISQCSGCILGMGETPEDIVWVSRKLSELEVHSIPVNFLNPVEGTRLQGLWRLNPVYCLKALCLFRFMNPKTEIRIAGGRELHLGHLQPMGLYPANSIFLGDYLTTPGQSIEADLQMIRDLGFSVAPPPASPACNHMAVREEIQITA